jgi:hypothetical protein
MRATASKYLGSFVSWVRRVNSRVRDPSSALRPWPSASWYLRRAALGALVKLSASRGGLLFPVPTPYWHAVRRVECGVQHVS